jgi:hypothetical protein
MRELKFRAWDNRDNQLIYFDDLYWFEEHYVHQNSGWNGYEISQFTGMIDSNDKEIYEGDLVDFNVKHYDEVLRYKNQEVIYKDKFGMFVFGEDEYCMAHRILEIHVVGNKWENK